VRATKVNAGLAESNGRLLLGIWRNSLHVTCGLTACTPGSASGPTLGNEYGKTLPLLYLLEAADNFVEFNNANYLSLSRSRRSSRVGQKSSATTTNARRGEDDSIDYCAGSDRQTAGRQPTLTYVAVTMTWRFSAYSRV